MNRTKTTLRRIMAIALSVCMMLTVTPITAMAEDGTCPHSHDDTCGYIEGAPCTFTHEHDGECGYDDGAGSACTVTHSHDEDCGYVEGADCGHVHDESYGGGLTPGDSGKAGAQTGKITAFAALDGEIASQTVPLGTSLDDLTLPSELAATVATPADAGDTVEATEAVPVTWESEPEYDGNTAGTYIFTAIVDGLTVSAELPVITVTVEEAALTGGIITAFDKLSEDIRFQRGTQPVLPEKLRGTVNGEAAEIPVTWYAEGYNPENYTGSGLFAFVAAPGEGYTLGEGVSAPTIAYFKLPLINPMMAGDGTSGKPLQITSAAQLFEIAAMTNLGMLESTILGNATATVHIQLANDIDLSAYSSGAGWTPIGFGSYTFKGSFDGGGNIITGLFINRPTRYTIGLFGYVDGGTVKNLGIVGATITGGDFTGGMAGYFRDGTVQNCYSTGTLNGVNSVGGVVGEVSNSGTVQNCYSASAVNGIGSVGGVAGKVDSGTVKNCAALNPSVSGTSEVGRVVGSRIGGTLSNNVAFSGMKITVDGSPKSSVGNALDHIDGLSKSTAEIRTDGTIGGLFTDDNDPWTCANGKLPGFGAAVDMPAHIVDTPGSDSNFFGAGSSTDPFLISTAADLAKLAVLVNNATDDAKYNASTVYYKLTADIDLSAYSSGTGWTPIGTLSNPFKGSFDGDGKKITGLYINRTEDYTGLFGNISSGTVKNVGIVGANITGGNYTGGVAGIVDTSTVQSCYVTGAVSGKSDVGGVAGYVYNGTIQNCYSAGSVAANGETTNANVGGVAGFITNSSTVQNCYSLATVTCGNDYLVGGVVGFLYASTVKNCAALNPSVSVGTGIESDAGRVVGDGSTGFSNNVAFDGMKITEGGSPKSPVGNALDDIDGLGKTAAEINAANFFQDVFAAPTTMWVFDTGKLPGFGAAVEMPAHLLGASPFAGAGTSAGDPYQIATAAQLAKLAELVNAGTSPYADNGKYYKLMNDIDLSAYKTGAGWVPIGNSSNRFRGSFDGNGKTITGLYINRNVIYTGLFGYVDGGTVKNLGVVDASVKGANITGGVAGYVNTSGTVQNCYVTGAVSGSSTVGGVAGGVDENSEVQNCYSTATVSGASIDGNVGGVAGHVVGGNVRNCYATGAVNGAKNVGGVVGNAGNSGRVISCAALNPSVSGTSNVGRVAGNNNGGTLSGNRAFSGMTGGGSLKTATGLDGLDMGPGEALKASFWTTPGNWDTTGGGTVWVGGGNPWTIVDDYLPSLSATVTVDSGLYLTPKTLEFADVTVTGTYTYTGSAQTPAVTIVFGDYTLVAGMDYTLAVTAGGTNAGTATVTVTGIGNYTGTKTATFTINPKNLTSAMLSIPAVTYNGAAQTPVLTVTDGVTPLVENTDYLINPPLTSQTNARTYTIVVYGAGNYTGGGSVNFIINRLALTGATVTLAAGPYTYTGSAIRPDVTAVSVNGVNAGASDYAANYSANIMPGTVTVTVTAESGSNFSGSATTTFTIDKAMPSAPTVTGSLSNNGQTYTYTITAPATGAQYKMDAGAWQASPVFSNITPGAGVQHTFYAKLTATATHFESPEGSTGAVGFPRLSQPPPAITYTRTGEWDNGGVSVTITSPATGATYSIDDITYNATNPIVFADGVQTADIYVKLDATATHEQSAAASVFIDFKKLDQAAPPAFSLTYTNVNDTNYTVTIPATPGAEYSFDGVNWSGTNTMAGQPGDVITGYKRMAGTATHNESPVTSAGVTLPPFQVKTPTASPDGGSFTTSQSVTLSCATSGASIYYTTDGTTPTIGSTPYTTAFTLTDTTTVKAIAVKAGMTDSAALSVTFTKQSTNNNNGGGSGGGGGSTASTAPTETWLEQNPARTLASGANGKNQGYARTSGTGTYGVRANAWQRLAGLRYEHDTMDGSSVQVRVYINDPAKITKDTFVSGHVKGSEVDYAKSTFEKYFNNKVRAIHMDQAGDWGQPVEIAAKVDLSGMDTTKLEFYAYDKATNTYRRIENPAYFVDKNGYLHFTTEYAGDIIISEGPLERK